MEKSKVGKMSKKTTTFTGMTTNTFVPFVLYISLHLSPASHSSHVCPLLRFFAPNIAHIFPQMPWADYNSSLALSLSPLTPSRCRVGSVINGTDAALDSWLHRASCWTTYWDTHANKNTQNTNSPRKGMTPNITGSAAPLNHSLGVRCLLNAPPHPTPIRETKALCPWISLEVLLAASVQKKKSWQTMAHFFALKKMTLLVSFCIWRSRRGLSASP